MTKATMIFARVDVMAPNHPRFLEVGIAGFGLWTAALCYSRQYELDGHVPLRALLASLGGGPDHEAVLASLVTAGLVTCDGVTVTILRYADRNETKAEIDSRRDASRDRQAAHRARLLEKRSLSRVTNTPPSRVTNAFLPDSDSDSDSKISDPERVQGEPTDEPSLEPALHASIAKATGSAPRLVDGDGLTREQAYAAAYCSGVARGKGGAYAWSAGMHDQGALNRAIQAHAKWGVGNDFGQAPGAAIRGEHLLGWVDDVAAEFGAWLAKKPPDEHRYYSAFGPKGFLRWLNETALKAEARRVG